MSIHGLRVQKVKVSVTLIVRAGFATMGLGMGTNFSGLTCTIDYGAPCSLDDYFQESGRAGRGGGEQSTSTIISSGVAGADFGHTTPPPPCTGTATSYGMLM